MVLILSTLSFRISFSLFSETGKKAKHFVKFKSKDGAFAFISKYMQMFSISGFSFLKKKKNCAQNKGKLQSP